MENLGEQQLSTKLQIGGLVLFLASYAILSALLQHKRYPIHRGAVAVLIGVGMGLIIRLTSSSTYTELTKINETIIFLILLPAMLFAKGYTFKKGAFIRSLKFIVLFGIIGTFLSFLITTFLIYAANQLNLVRDAKDITNFRTLSIWEVILLSACLCSIDTVASEEQVDQNRFPKLNSIIMGEDTFKDCVTIVLFRAILRLEEMESPSKFVFYWYTPFKIILNFVFMIVGSCLLGIAVGIITTFVFKRMRFLQNDKGITQTTVLFLLGFATYILAECATLSGIVSILCFGVTLNRYNYFNLSQGGQVSSKTTFLFVSNICEGLLFLIMGMMVWEIEWEQEQPTNPITHSYVFCLIVFLILIVGRFFNVYVLWIISKFVSPKFDLNKYQLFIIFISGIARGATPFALFTSVQIIDQSKYAKNQGLVLKTTIIIIVMFCTVILNSIIPTIFKKPLKKLRAQAKQYLLSKSHENQGQNKYQKLAKSHFKKFQQEKLKPALIYEYEDRKEQIKIIKQKIASDHLKAALQQLEQQQQQQLDKKHDESLLSN